MTVRINKPALNLREELTKAQGVVRYEQRQFWMDGLVENGTFDNGTTGWSAGNGATLSVSSGQLSIQSNGSQYGSNAGQEITTIKGKTYKIYADCISGSLPKLRVGTTSALSGDLLNKNLVAGETETGTFIAASSVTYVFVEENNINSTSVFDNIAVFEVDENDNVIHSLPLGFKPLHVYEDGLIQREGDVHDYTVVKTSGAYAIKPAVQPTATTETCIIAEREL